jgi:hypothetical protein
MATLVHADVKNLSLANARRLVDTYGASVVRQALSKVIWLNAQRQATNPAGLLITLITQVWRNQHGWNATAPVFKAEPKRKSRPKKYDPRQDPITKSEAWLRWSIWFWYEHGDMEAVEWRQARLVELGFAPEVVGDDSGGEIFEELPF